MDESAGYRIKQAGFPAIPKAVNPVLKQNPETSTVFVGSGSGLLMLILI